MGSRPPRADHRPGKHCCQLHCYDGPADETIAAAAVEPDTSGPHVQNVICRKILDLVPAVDFDRNFCTLGVVERFAP